MTDFTGQSVPMARSEDILVESLGDEVLIYDLRTHEATCLNASAALILDSCDGQRTIEDIVDAVGNDEVTEQHVTDIIDKLCDKNLLEVEVDATLAAAQASVSRRSFVTNAAVASLVLPVVMSTAIPPAAAQAPDFAPCDGNPDCNVAPNVNDKFCCTYNTPTGNAKCCLPETFNECPGASNAVFQDCAGFGNPT